MGHYDDQYESQYEQRRRERRAHNEPIIRQFEAAVKELHRLDIGDKHHVQFLAQSAVLWMRWNQPKEE